MLIHATKPFESGNLEQALAEYLRSIKSARKIKDDDMQAHIYQKIGTVYMDLNKIDGAIYAYNKALNIVKDNSTSTVRGGVMHDIARAYFYKGSIDESIVAFTSALKYFKDTDNPLGFNGALFELGRALVAKEEYSSALSAFEKCRIYSEASGDLSAYAKSLHEIGTIFSQQGKPRSALPLFKRTLSIEESVGSPSDLVVTLNKLAITYLSLNFFKKSRRCIDRSLGLTKTLQGNRSIKANTYEVLAAICLIEKNEQEALTALHLALGYYNEPGEKAKYALTSCLIAHILFNNFEDVEGSLKYFKESFEILDELDHPMKAEIGKRIVFIECKKLLDSAR
ncbi:MAG: hypothetical protein DCF25_21945 [Leptolyngbya foveolarum]|uniref:Uncharacterized protein n=1 Tax=Leptolyngbya foveolarum TaxID=47253 RepID=A0A2W4TPI6_9CYAN|nr:MAG: hypothetical protein DCF25_21945 [Leptolyngbya foveolarum]